jgi:hypothetical protein
METTQKRTITPGAVVTGRILPQHTDYLSAAHFSPGSSSASASAVPANHASKNKTLADHIGIKSVPELLRPTFTWRDAATRGLTLLNKRPGALSENTQRDRLFHVLSMVLTEDGKDAYMIWEDFRKIDGSQPLPDHWLTAIVRHLRHNLRLRTMFGPEISDDDLLAAFSRWDENITRTLRNVNQVVTATPTIDGVTVLWPPVWLAAFSCLASLIATDQQILSCYRSYWETLTWRHNTESVFLGTNPKSSGTS